MAHRYTAPIEASCSDTNRPTSFVWRGARYRIAEVLATWHLQDRWWEPPSASAGAASTTATARASAPPSDRLYYRVRCSDQQTFDLYYDAACGRWVLDCVHD